MVEEMAFPLVEETERACRDRQLLPRQIAPSGSEVGDLRGGIPGPPGKPKGGGGMPPGMPKPPGAGPPIGPLPGSIGF